MQIYSFNENNKIFYSTLSEALYQHGIEPAVVSLIGAGGKTSTMYTLADEFADFSKDVIVTTSTKICYPDISCCKHSFSFITANNYSEFESEFLPLYKQKANVHNRSITICGRPYNDKKLQGFDYNNIKKLINYCSLLLIEADGARCLPLKVPYPHEPVIIPETDTVIICIGLDCIGHRLSNVCYNYETAVQILGSDKIITPNDISLLISCEKGLLKGIPASAKIQIILNKADTANEVSILGTYNAVYERTGKCCIITSHTN